jgi:hypothetical protein
VLIPWCAGLGSNAVTATCALSNTSVYLVPLYIDETITYTKIGAQVNGTPGAGSTIDLIIYDNDGSGGLPGTVLISSKNLSSAAAGLVEGTISFSPTRKYYWMGIQRNATASVSVYAISNADAYSFFTNRAYVSIPNPTNTIVIPKYLGSTNTYGTYPNNPTITNTGPVSAVPLIYLR